MKRYFLLFLLFFFAFNSKAQQDPQFSQYIFNNLSSLGCCDIVALNTKGETLLIDIKTVTRRKDKSIINRVPTKQQRKLNIVLLMVDKKNCYFVK